MNTIPEEFQINDLLNQDTYLLNGEVKKWRVKLLLYFLLFRQQKNIYQLF
jgi:hypothetical protein